MSGYYNQQPPQQQFGYPQQPSQGGPGWHQPPPQQVMGYPGQNQQHPPQNFGASQHFNQGPPPPQQGFNQYGPPPNSSGFNQPLQTQGAIPPQSGFQQYPQAQQPMPSPGYDNAVAQGDASADIHAFDKALSGFRKDHSTVIRILSKPTPAQMALLRQTYSRLHPTTTLEKKVESDFRSHYGDTLTQLVRGPCLADAHNVNRAIKGVGTKEDMLNDVLVGRSNADMRAIKAAYQQVFRKSMEQDVKEDLSLKTEVMFDLIMRASRTEEGYPFNPQETARDVESLHQAFRGPAAMTNQEAVYTILTQRSDNQIRAIAHQYQQVHHRTLEDSIKANFSGHMQDALLLCTTRATDRAKSDAFQFEDSMKGMGTKDNLLVNRTVRVHWDRTHMDQVKRAYQHFFKKSLIDRVRGETSGDYRDALVACLT